MANNDSPKKVVRTEAQMFPLVESWIQSKLTQKQFSEQHGLAPHILPYWVNRYRQQQPLPGETAYPFGEVALIRD